RKELADQVRKALGINTDGQNQTFTQDQVQQIVQQQIEKFKQTSDTGAKLQDSATKAKQANIAAFDALTRRLIADATVEEKVKTANLAVLDTLLQHDQATMQQSQPASAPQAAAA